MKTKNKYVGLDVHQVYPPPAAPRATRDTTVVAVADGDRHGDGTRGQRKHQRTFSVTMSPPALRTHTVWRRPPGKEGKGSWVDY